MSDPDLLVNLTLYMRSGVLAKLLFLDEIYRKIVTLPGIIFEFGTWLGASMVAFENLRAVHEPYNAQRRIIGFDTFAGYEGIREQDVRGQFTHILEQGTYTAPEGYEAYLRELLKYHEGENVMAHIEKHELVRGDASITCAAYIEDHPEALIAMAYFDMALYEPTVRCLNAIMPRLMKGSLIVFDELGFPDYPGETTAYLEALSGRAHSIQRSSILADRTYITIEE